MPFVPPSSRIGFEVAVICALPKEYDAISLLFDEFWDERGDTYGRAAGDDNHYTTGRIGKHNVVLALLEHIGKRNAASAAANMRSSYSALKLALLVGVCGAVPGDGRLLGDVIISKSVVQYDFGRLFPHGFKRKDTLEDNLGQPGKDIRNLLASFETTRVIELLEQQTAAFLRELQTKAAGSRRHGKDKYEYPGTVQDVLYEPKYRHKHRRELDCICESYDESTDLVCDAALTLSCEDLGCDTSHVVARKSLEVKQQLEQQEKTKAQKPVLQIGAIASGDTVMKSAEDRDRIAKKEGVIAFEMEGAGVWDVVPCIVVKGICDYADAHKQKGWQNFAAATAASAAKAILERYTQTDRVQDAADTEPKGVAVAGTTWVDQIRFGDYNKGSQIGISPGTVNNSFYD